MNKYQITMTATVTKEFIVEANSEEEAYITAHETFSVLEDGVEERYKEDIDGCVLIT
jgi:hypothetical protein